MGQKCSVAIFRGPPLPNSCSNKYTAITVDRHKQAFTLGESLEIADDTRSLPSTPAARGKKVVFAEGGLL
ncbi:hypothetical protein GE061_014175 [Apolygus lucorum]|uniref:Uncharacterized protein n=1 Tax=Apolygus lucorum TaxID=248454 RepID=A0A8S9XPT2_APOLU|nr:hypothetical protein GE061_014175 [Apolygus lucorum]